MDWPLISLGVVCFLQFLLHLRLSRRVRVNESTIGGLWRKVPKWHDKMDKVSEELKSISEEFEARNKRKR